MKKTLLSLLCLSAVAIPDLTAQTTASSAYGSTTSADRDVFFDYNDEGKSLPILWGMDTAWLHEGNMRKGIRYIGADNLSVARVSFQPAFDFLGTSTTLTDNLENRLVNRLKAVSMAHGDDTKNKIKLVLNNDAVDDASYRKEYANAGSNPAAAEAYANLIYATMKSCQDKGWEVITVSPLNEPDYQWNNQGSKADFKAINKSLQRFPEFASGTVRISGGNTLNCDEAASWYDFLKEDLAEGNTHQLAGDFDHYAAFFTKVREDGKWATGDELHNIMEAMVGAEYGMQTGIWWGAAELARGEFCKASTPDGRRLAYAENRKAWSAASVYRNPEGKVQAFLSASERQAAPSTYRLVSTTEDVYFDGHGPLREYVVDVAGGNGYQVNQPNPECVVQITRGEDVMPLIDGDYVLINKKSKRAMEAKDAKKGQSVQQQTYSKDKKTQIWTIKKLPSDNHGDYSYYSIVLGGDKDLRLYVPNYSHDPNTDLQLNVHTEASWEVAADKFNSQESWYLRYAGDGYFYITNRESNLYLQPKRNSNSTGVNITQAEFEEGNEGLLWRIIPAGTANANNDRTAPAAPADLKATPRPASVLLEWNAVADNDLAGYVVLRSIEGKNDFNTIARGLTETSFLDNTVAPGVKYTYKIKATDKCLNTSAASNEVSAETDGTRGIIAQYLFDGNFTDEQTNTFTATGKSVDFVDGHQGNAARVRSNEYIQLPYALANNEEMTVCTWVQGGNNTSDARIFDFGNGENCHMYLAPNENGSMVFAIRKGDREDRVTADAITDRNWNHVAVTIANGYASLYVNGTKVASGSIGIQPSELNATLNYIGRPQDASKPYFTGAIDDFRVYNAWITSDNVAAAMNGSTGIGDVSVSDPLVVATEYYNLQGMLVNEPANGVFIKREIHADGTSTTTKVVLR